MYMTLKGYCWLRSDDPLVWLIPSYRKGRRRIQWPLSVLRFLFDFTVIPYVCAYTMQFTILSLYYFCPNPICNWIESSIINISIRLYFAFNISLLLRWCWNCNSSRSVNYSHNRQYNLEIIRKHQFNWIENLCMCRLWCVHTNNNM